MDDSYEWNKRKDQINLAKHGIAFAEAIAIFDYPRLTKIDERLDYGEKREISIGAIEDGLVLILVVVHITRKSIVRIISARKANKRERELYYEYIKKKT